MSYSGHSIYVKNVTVAELNAAQFTFIPVAEAPGVDKAAVAEEFTVSDKRVISDDATLVEKAIVSDGDNFTFVQKEIVSDDLVGVTSDFADFVINQDIMSQFLAEAQILRETYLGDDSVLETGHEIDTGLYTFTEFFGFL